MLRLILVLLWIILFLLVGIPVLLFEMLLAKKHPEERDRQVRAIVRWVFRIVLFLAGTELVVEGKEQIPTDKSVLFVGNHRSYFDIVTTYTQMERTTGYVAKTEMKRIPLLSQWMQQISCLFLDRSDIKAGLGTILQAIEQVKSGRSVFIFPEGTRNDAANPTELMTFHEGSLKIAQKAKSPVIPVAIYGTDLIFERHMPFIRPAKVVIRFGAPIDINALPAEQKKKPGQYLRQHLTEMLGELAANHTDIAY